jgi:Zn-dependent protease with chaperone function
MRMVVEQGVLNIGLGLALGDVSGVVSTGATVLTGRAYSRNHEREADCYAIAAMQHAALPTAPMGQLLLAIARKEAPQPDASADQGKSAKSGNTTDSQAAASAPTPPASTANTANAASGANAAASRTASVPPSKKNADSPLWSLMSTHPDTVERATELEQGHAPHCAR